jgi:hypothetical protein
VTFSGRDVFFEGAEVESPGGKLYFRAVGEDGGTVPLQEILSRQRGSLVVTNSSLNSSGDGGGTLGFEAGSVKLIDSILHADNETLIDSRGGVRINAADFSMFGGGLTADTLTSADAGTVQIKAGNMHLDGGTISSNTHGAGNAGIIDFEVGELLSVVDGGVISSDTYGSGHAGNVLITAGKLINDDGWISSDTTLSGNAGALRLDVGGAFEVVNGGKISSDTYGRGDAGPVQVKAGSIYNDHGWVSSDTMGSGKAGTISLTVIGQLKVVNQGVISSDAFASGDAGTVTLSAGSLRIDGQGATGTFTGISSEALLGASGLAGDIFIQAEEMQLLNNGRISIANYGTLPAARLAHFSQGLLRIEAGTLEIAGASIVGALATGNVPASSVELRIDDRLVVQGTSRITTETRSSDGGNVIINGSGAVLLRDGLISTSTQGGTGGNITMRPGALTMDNGFVQANTAVGARGGDILIDVPYFITPQGILPLVGALERLRFVAGSGSNVIQAAAPGGEQGDINIITPELDVSASLGTLGARFLVPVRLGTDSCQIAQGGIASSLVIAGHGGIPAGPEQPSAVVFSQERLAAISDGGIEEGAKSVRSK